MQENSLVWNKLFMALIVLFATSLLVAQPWGGEFYYGPGPGLVDIMNLDPTDSYFIVGDGSHWVAETGNTAKTSLGLGTNDTPAWAGATFNGDVTQNFTGGSIVSDYSADAMLISDDVGWYFGSSNDTWIVYDSVTDNLKIDNRTSSIGFYLSLPTLIDDKLSFTQTDGDEFIDSLADGYMDYGATTAHRFNNDVVVTGDVSATTIGGTTPAPGTFTVLTANTTVNFDGATTQNGNSLTISDADNIETQYDWLAHSDRDGDMGALSVTNRRTLFLLPGTWTITSVWELDTDYVDICSVSLDPSDTVVTRATGDVTVEQTADDVRLTGFTIKNAGTASGDRGLEINATDNSASIYRYMIFDTANTIGKESVYGVSAINGTWEFCEGGGWAWVLAANISMDATFRFCGAGTDSWKPAAIASTGVISGRFENCIGGIQCFGGDDGQGCEVSATLIDCEAGDGSYAMGAEFSGRAINCKGGLHCFGGYNGGGNYFGTFSGYALNCETEGGHCFGTGHASCVQSGRIDNCLWGTPGHYATGVLSGFGSAVVTDNGALATLTMDSASANGDITYTATSNGVWGHNITITHKVQAAAFPPLGTVIISDDKMDIVVTVSVDSGSTFATAANVKGYIDGDSEAASYVTTAVEGDGSGDVEEEVATALTGGVDSPFFRSNHPPVPTACTANTTVRAFDSGHTYNNTGVSGTITFTLPDAIAGYEFTFARTDVGAGNDIRIDPQAGDHIEKSDGAAMANGEYYANEADDYGLVKLIAINSTTWQVVLTIGTWVEETP